MYKLKLCKSIRFRKGLAFVTAFATMVCMTLAPAAAFADTEIEKEESVYVITDSTGEQQEVIVSDHLKNGPQIDKIADKSDLKEIENVKGDETFNQGSGNELTWDAGGKDIYYQGKTNKEVPVVLNVKYYLDGKEVSSNELKGKDGNVTIRIKYENNTSVNDTKVPFIVMSGFIVEDDCLKNITVDNGKVIDDGEKQVVVGLAAPGLAEDLDIDSEEIGLGDSVTIKGKAKNFDVDDIMTIATSSVFDDIKTGKLDDLDYDDEIDELDKGSKALVDGSKQLYDGITKLNDKMPELEDGVDQLANGANELYNGTKSAQAGAKKVSDGVQQLKEELPATLSKLVKGLKSMKSGVEQLETSMQQIKAALEGYAKALNGEKQDQYDVIAYLMTLKGIYDSDSLSDGQRAIIQGYLAAAGLDINDIDTIITKAKTVYGTMDVVANGSADDPSTKDKNEYTPGLNGLAASIGDKKTQKTVMNGLDQLDQGASSALKQINGKSEELNDGLGQLSKGTKDLKNGEDQLASGAKQLADGMESLQSNSSKLADGVDKLDSGSEKLSKGMSKLYNEGIKKIVDLYKDDLKGLTNGIKDMRDATKEYKTFTMLPSDMKGSTKFIYKTPITEQ